MKYVKLFEEFEQYASFHNDFKPTNSEEMSKVAPGGLPKELENIKFKFAGKKFNFGITEDDGVFKVYKWTSIYEVENIGESDDMRRIKSFCLFEAIEVPEHFIPLESISHYLDTKSGLIYPMLAAGGYEDKGYPFVDNEDDWIDLPRISPEDMRLVDPFWKSSEGLIKPKLNWDLINAVKQIAVSEELIDHGCYVRIRAQADPINITLYYEMFDKDEKPFYPREFSDVIEQIASIEPSKIEYDVTVMKQHENGRLLPVKMDFRPDVENEGVRSMMMRLEDMYPDENIKFHQW